MEMHGSSRRMDGPNDGGAAAVRGSGGQGEGKGRGGAGVGQGWGRRTDRGTEELDPGRSEQVELQRGVRVHRPVLDTGRQTVNTGTCKVKSVSQSGDSVNRDEGQAAAAFRV